jgi:hypothetical protein
MDPKGDLKTMTFEEMQNKFPPPDKAFGGRKTIFLTGLAATGKTQMALSTLPDEMLPAYVDMFDPSGAELQSVFDMEKAGKIVVNRTWQEMRASNVPKAWYKHTSLNMIQQAKIMPFKTWIVDSITAIVLGLREVLYDNQTQNKEIENRYMKMEDKKENFYAIASDMLISAINLIRNAPVNIILIGHIDEIPGRKDEANKFQLSMPGASKRIIMTLFGETWLNTTEGYSQNKRFYTQLVDPTGKYPWVRSRMAGSYKGEQNLARLEPDIAKIFNLFN